MVLAFCTSRPQANDPPTYSPKHTGKTRADHDVGVKGRTFPVPRPERRGGRACLRVPTRRPVVYRIGHPSPGSGSGLNIQPGRVFFFVIPAANAVEIEQDGFSLASDKSTAYL